MAKKVTVNLSSVTGKFIKEGYAKKHPRTTEKEHYRKSGRKSGRSERRLSPAFLSSVGSNEKGRPDEAGTPLKCFARSPLTMK